MSVLVQSEQAQAADPRRPYRTMLSGRFELNFPAEYEGQAQRALELCEEILPKLEEEFDWRVKSRIQVVLNDDTDSANGSATALPYPTMQINLIAPSELSELGEHDEWLYVLILHELVHIVQLDMSRGIIAIINKVLGRTIYPNQIQPRFITEGIATELESSMSFGGRVGSAYFDMLLRTEIMENKVFKIDEVASGPRRFPQGSVYYAYGSYFFRYLKERYGQDLVREISDDYSGRIPYGINTSIRRATGKTYDDHYPEFLEWLQARFQPQIDAYISRPKPPYRVLSVTGQNTHFARSTADGGTYFVADPLSDHAELRRIIPGKKNEAIRWLNSGATFDVDPNGHFALVAQNETYRIFRNYGDLYRIDLPSGKKKRLTYGERARDPDISADGKHLAYVKNHPSEPEIWIRPLDNFDAAKKLLSLGPNSQIFGPRFSADKKRIVFSAMLDGARDLFIADTTSGEWTRLTNDRAIDSAPTFLEQQNAIVFHSTREQFFNLYTLSLSDRSIRRLSNLPGGALHPEVSSDGTSVYFDIFRSQGFDIAEMDVPKDIQTLPEVPNSTYTHEGPRRLPKSKANTVESRPYRAYRSIYPRAYAPIIGNDPRGLLLGLGTQGRDVLARHAWALNLSYGIASQYVAFGAAYQNRQSIATVSIDLSRSLAILAPTEDIAENYPSGVLSDTWTSSISASIPLYQRRDLRLQTSIRYGFRFNNIIDPQGDPNILGIGGPRSSLSASIGISSTQRYGTSISSEDGGFLNISASGEHPYLGSSVQRLSLGASGGYFWETPWLENHVIAFNAFIGYGFSDVESGRAFSVSGAGIVDPRNLLLFGSGGTSGELRGLSTTPVLGDFLLEGHLEYRFPLIFIDRGVLSTPAFFRQLSAAVFLDVADIEDRVQTIGDGFLASAGLEISLSGELLYGLAWRITAGYGHGIMPSDQQRFYFLVGL